MATIATSYYDTSDMGSKILLFYASVCLPNFMAEDFLTKRRVV
jgi:hypothetical protein